ncbi:hypothetical protein XENTR_v10022474 [Xenopus tropicalis]|nr:hypothetical protein XENTR_v10022474 [Xenopus tropicalis]
MKSEPAKHNILAIFFFRLNFKRYAFVEVTIFYLFFFYIFGVFCKYDFMHFTPFFFFSLSRINMLIFVNFFLHSSKNCSI